MKNSKVNSSKFFLSKPKPIPLHQIFQVYHIMRIHVSQMTYIYINSHTYRDKHTQYGEKKQRERKKEGGRQGGRDCIGLPAQEVQHLEAEAPIWDNNVFFSMFSTEQRGENSSGCLSVCSILQWAFCWHRGWALWRVEEGPQTLS